VKAAVCAEGRRQRSGVLHTAACGVRLFALALVAVVVVAGSPFAGAAAKRDFFAPGALTVVVEYDEWLDATRGRKVPLKLYLPQGAGPFPVILFSHGLGGSREGGRLWAEHWASHGYFCIALQHIGSDESLWRAKDALLDRWRGLRRGMTAEEYAARIADVRFVLDALERRRDDPRLRRADRSRIGLAGHSFGAQTTQALAGERPLDLDAGDVRIKAAVAFSPSARGTPGSIERRFSGVRIPFFSITGTADGDVVGTGATPENRTLPFRYMRGPGKYLLVLENADHFTFAGQTDLAALRWREPDAAHGLVRAATLAFWEAHLRDDAAAQSWLREGGLSRHLGAGDRFEWK
jgi:predicted dienelactone hydrolase